MDSKCPKYDKVYKEILESEEVSHLHDQYKVQHLFNLLYFFLQKNLFWICLIFEFDSNNCNSSQQEFFVFVSNKTKKLNLNISNIWEIHDVIYCEVRRQNWNNSNKNKYNWYIILT